MTTMVKIFKLVTEEEVIGKVEEFEFNHVQNPYHEYRVTDVLQARYSFDSADYSLFFTKYNPMSISDTINIKKEHVLFISDPKKSVGDFYHSYVSNYKKKVENYERSAVTSAKQDPDEMMNVLKAMFEKSGNNTLN